MASWSLPVLNEPFDPSKNNFRRHPDASHATAKIIAAATQLASTLMGPGDAVHWFLGWKPLKAAALRVCLESNVPEILREAGPEISLQGIAFHGYHSEIWLQK
ncbi:hypothetical protein B0H13DRAFT_1865874 [Mycena leptocephala]|nr:hypothetical protein B0H13DRAFT_1865874 [Mycena leptocephala]